jgi:hypothetical protein
MSDEPHDVGHGNSVAAWTAVLVIAVGSIVSAVGVAVSEPWLFWVGVVVMALGLVVGKVLAMMGFGVERVSPVADTADLGE